jgi:hypothetical protein
LLSNYLLNCTYCELFTEGNMGFEMDIIHTHTHTHTHIYIYIYIRNSVDVRINTGYVLTEQEGYMNTGQYYNQ